LFHQQSEVTRTEHLIFILALLAEKMYFWMTLRSCCWYC